MKKLILSIFISLLISYNVFGMFIVGKQTTEGFVGLGEDEELKSRVYDMLMTYQYPMNLILPEGDYGTLFEPVENGEKDFLQKKLKEISSDLDIAYMSTTLWELYALDMIEHENKAHPDNLFHYMASAFSRSATIPPLEANLVADVMAQEDVTRQSVHKAYHQLNFIPEIKSLYLKINDIIINDSNASSAEVFESDLKNKAISNSHKFSTNNFLDNIILSEMSPNPEDKVWLYRVTRIVKDRFPIYADDIPLSDIQKIIPLIDDPYTNNPHAWHEKSQHNLSYGISMFASYIYDPGACVMDYAHNNYLYRIALQKSEARQHDDSSNFVINPINMLAYLFSTEMRYHVWTKTVDDASLAGSVYYNPSMYVSLCRECGHSPDYSKLSIQTGSFLEFEREIAQLLSKSELFAVKGAVPTPEMLSYWETLKEHETKHAEYLQASLERRNEPVVDKTKQTSEGGPKVVEQQGSWVEIWDWVFGAQEKPELK